MAAPTPVAAGAYLTEASGASAAIAAPPGVQQGDIVLVFLYKENTAAVTRDTGFAELGHQAATGVQDHDTYLFAKTATANEPATYSFSWTGAAHRTGFAVAVRGADPVVEAYNGNTTGSTSDATSPPVSVTTLGLDRLLLWFGGTWDVTAWTTPTGYTPDAPAGAPASRLTHAAYRSQATAGSSGTVQTTTPQSYTKTAHLVALKPAGTAYTATLVDTVGIGDTLAPTSSTTRALADPVAITDTTAAAQGTTRELADTVGITDVVGILYSRTLTDSAGIADTVARQADTARELVDPVGIADTTTRAHAAARDLADELPIGDALDVVEVEPPGGEASTLTPDLYAVDWAGDGRLTRLPEWVRVALSPVRNDVGALSVDYPQTGAGFDVLDAGVAADPPRVLMVEVRLGGSAQGRRRGFLVQKRADDKLTAAGVVRFDGHDTAWLLDKALVAPQPKTTDNAKGELLISGLSYGGMLQLVVDQAQDRPGVLPGMSLSFTASHDSNGDPWAGAITNLKIPPKTTVLDVCQKGVELGVGEFWVDDDLVLHAVNPGGRGRDLTGGPTPLVFAHAVNLAGYSQRESAKDAASAVLAAGGEGVYAWAQNATAEASLGFRAEAAVDAGNIEDTGAVLAYAQGQAEILGTGLAEYQSDVELTPTGLRPLLNYDVGDWGTAVVGTQRRRLRIAQVAVEWVRGSSPRVTVAQNDLVSDALAALIRRLHRVTSGDAVVGTSTATPVEVGPDTMAPAAPTGLVVGSNIAYQNADDPSGITLAEVTVGWSPVTTNADGTPADDVAAYRVQYAYLGPNQVGGIPSSNPDGGPLAWHEPVGSPTSQASLTFGDAEAARQVGVRVAALDYAGNQSEWSDTLAIDTQADEKAPPVPAAAVLSTWFRTMDITTDGLGSVGEPMPTDYSHTEVWVGRSATPGPPTGGGPVTDFDPAATAAQHVADLFGAGTWNQPDLPVGVGWYAWLVSVDRTGNRSAPSATAGPVTAQQLVQLDIGPDAIGRQQVIDLEVVRAKIADLAVNSAKVEEIEAGLVTTGTLVATVTLTGIIQTASSGLRWRGDTTGIRFYNSSNELTIDLRGDAGNVLLTGTIQSALNGERWMLLPDGTLRLYPAAGNNYSQIANFGNDVVWRGPLDGNGRSGRLNVNALGVGINFSSEAEIPNNLRAEMVVFDRRARTTAPMIDLELNGKLSTPDGGPRRVTFAQTNSSGVRMASSVLEYKLDAAGNPGMVGISNDAGWKAEDGWLLAVSAALSDLRPMKASDFVIPSTGAGKEDIEDVRAVLDPAATIRDTLVRKYVRTADKWYTPPPTPEDPNPEPVPVPDPPVSIGVIAEEVPALLQADTPAASGSGTELAVSVPGQIATLWGAVWQILHREERVAVGRVTVSSGALLAGAVAEYPVTWDEPPLAVPNAGAVIVYAAISWLGKTTATVKPGTVTATGCTITVTALAAVAPSISDPITYEVQSAYDYFPPYVPPEEP